MDNEKIAAMLVKVAKVLLSGDRTRINYALSSKVVEVFNRVHGIDSVGVSDGFNDETTFTVYLDLEVTAKDWSRRNSGGMSPSNFAIPLRKIGGIIKSELAKVSIDAIAGDKKVNVQPVLDSKIFVPRANSWRDEYGKSHRVYVNSRVSFDVFMKWER